MRIGEKIFNKLSSTIIDARAKIGLGEQIYYDGINRDELALIADLLRIIPDDIITAIINE